MTTRVSALLLAVKIITIFLHIIVIQTETAIADLQISVFFIIHLCFAFNKTNGKCDFLAILFYLFISKDTTITSPFFCTKTKSVWRNCQNESQLLCLLLILKTNYPIFFRYPIHRCCRLVQRQSLAKINPKKTCFYQQQQNLSLLREFFL